METSDTTALATTDQAIVVDEFVGYGEDKIIDRSDIRPSKTNRKFFSQIKLKELAENIKKVGILQRILVRPVVPTPEEPEHYEIVYGERRWLAAEIAGLMPIPCCVKKLTDSQAAEIQIFENLHKENPHPLEEAMGYQNLMLSHGHTADGLVTLLNQSRSYIYGRLKLCSLTVQLHQDFMEDRFSASVALIIARIPVPSLQVKAANEVAPYTGNPEIEPMSAREAARHIKGRYTLYLTGAIFNKHDEKLVKEAGSCMKCPKRTGNQKEVYEDISDEFICTDPDCFAEKLAAHEAKKVAAAVKEGVPVYEGDEADDFLHDETPAELSDKLFCFDRISPEVKDFNATIESLLDEKQRPEPIAYIKNDAGLVTPVFSQTAMQEALEKAGICFAVEVEIEGIETTSAPTVATPRTVTSANGTTLVTKNTDAYLEKQAINDELKLKAEKVNNYRLTLYKLLRQRSFTGFSLESLREFVSLVATDEENFYSVPTDILSEFYPLEDDSRASLLKYINCAPLEAVQMILVDMVLGSALTVTHLDLDGEDNAERFNTLLAMARAEGIDPDDVRAELEKPAAVIQSDEPAQEATKTPAKRSTWKPSAPAIMVQETIKTPAKRGRKPKVAEQPQPDLITPESDSGQPNPADAKAPDPVDAPPAKTPGKRGPKPKQKESDSVIFGTLEPTAAWPFPKGVQ